jgi:hypothetical protein
MNFSVAFVLFFCSVISVTSQDFRNIANYPADDDGNVKEVFMANLLNDNWLNAYVFCKKHEMELLRIESYKELINVKKALKIHWLDFDNSLFIDGRKRVDNKWGKLESWEFLSNEKIMDSSIINDATTSNLWSFKTDSNCLSIGKYNLEPKIIISNCFTDYNGFLCQKVQKAENKNNENDQKLPIEIDVRSRFFENIGFYEFNDVSTLILMNITYFVNRKNYSLSPIMASNFCKHFNMKLVDIETEIEFRILINFLKLHEKDSERFTFRSATGISWKFPPATSFQQCSELTTANDGTIYYSKCKGDKLGFICEDDKLVGQQLQPKRTTGMKLLATFDLSMFES